MPKPFTEAERQEFLAGKHIAALSVQADNGRPPATVPIWYDYVPGGDIRVNTGAGRRKARLIQEAGVVSLLVQREELPYQYVIVEGTVVDATTPSPRDARVAIATRYLGPEEGRAFADRMDGTDSVLFTIRPDRWITQDYSGDL
jgi:PPOX class probable F420-dependent enzyme